MGLTWTAFAESFEDTTIVPLTVDKGFPLQVSLTKKLRIERGGSVYATVVEKFRAGMFSLQLEAGQKVLATLAGRLRRNRIKVMNGDRVSVELSPYDLTKGRITYRHK